MGHVILQRMVDDAGLSDDVRVSSSGTGDWHVGEHADPRTVEVLARHGYDGSRHRAREFDPDEFDELDLILASDEGHVRTLNRLARAPHHRGKIRLVREFDPAGRGGRHPRDGRPVVRRTRSTSPGASPRSRPRAVASSTTSGTSWTSRLADDLRPRGHRPALTRCET